jgi:hypothetical protein
VNKRLDFGHFAHTESQPITNWSRMIKRDRIVARIEPLRRATMDAELARFCNAVDYSVACANDRNFGCLAFR